MVGPPGRPCRGLASWRMLTTPIRNDHWVVTWYNMARWDQFSKSNISVVRANRRFWSNKTIYFFRSQKSEILRIGNFIWSDLFWELGKRYCGEFAPGFTSIAWKSMELDSQKWFVVITKIWQFVKMINFRCHEVRIRASEAVISRMDQFSKLSHQKSWNWRNLEMSKFSKKWSLVQCNAHLGGPAGGSHPDGCSPHQWNMACRDVWKRSCVLQSNTLLWVGKCSGANVEIISGRKFHKIVKISVDFP